jgi:hypothetical protein
MNAPPESSYSSNHIRLFICLSYFLAKRLCPDTPPLLKHVSHRTSLSMKVGVRYLQKLVLFHRRSCVLERGTVVWVHDLSTTLLNP